MAKDRKIPRGQTIVHIAVFLYAAYKISRVKIGKKKKKEKQKRGFETKPKTGTKR